MPKCSTCGKYFSEYRNAEERLLQALFGGPFCRVHRMGEIPILCTKCGKEVVNPMGYNGEYFHSRCLPRGDQ